MIPVNITDVLFSVKDATVRFFRTLYSVFHEWWKQLFRESEGISSGKICLEMFFTKSYKYII